MIRQVNQARVPAKSAEVFCATSIALVAGRHQCMQNENRWCLATGACGKKIYAGEVVCRKSSLNRAAPSNCRASAFQAFAKIVILRRGIILVSRDPLAFLHITRHFRAAGSVKSVAFVK